MNKIYLLSSDEYKILKFIMHSVCYIIINAQ